MGRERVCDGKGLLYDERGSVVDVFKVYDVYEGIRTRANPEEDYRVFVGFETLDGDEVTEVANGVYEYTDILEVTHRLYIRKPR